jgi:hypothetical protein
MVFNFSFSFGRGILPQTLNKIRSMGDEQYYLEKKKEESLSKDMKTHHSPRFTFNFDENKKSKRNGQDDCDEHDKCDGMERKDDHEEDSVAEEKHNYRKNSSSSSGGLSGGDVIMRNFRELLFYWTEYYLRRGRDRLSIEFSCHIPFHFWYELVGKKHL